MRTSCQVGSFDFAQENLGAQFKSSRGRANAIGITGQAGLEKKQPDPIYRPRASVKHGKEPDGGPMRKLRSELERGISRAWEGLTEGWREVLVRSSGALTHFVRAAKQKKAGAQESQDGSPQWALLAGESWETAQSVIVQIEMPGMRKEDIDVSIYRGGLRIRGEKRSAGDHQGRLYHLMERAFGRFERTLSLPHNIDVAKAEVSYQDGVITVIVPKTVATPPTHLSVK
jgi:HSP20 family protein